MQANNLAQTREGYPLKQAQSIKLCGNDCLLNLFVIHYVCPKIHPFTVQSFRSPNSYVNQQTRLIRNQINQEKFNERALWWSCHSYRKSGTNNFNENAPIFSKSYLIRSFKPLPENLKTVPTAI